MKNNLLQNKKVAIIGGGPVGLTTARLLQNKGIDVTIYERDLNDDARISGGTLDLHKGTGQKALAEAGLIHEFFENSRPMGMCVLDITGKILMKMKPDIDKPEIDRPVLRKILLNSLHPETVVWNTQIIKLEKEKNGFGMIAKDGNVFYANTVIVADGGMSMARQSITDDLPEETGTYVIQGEIRNFKNDCPSIYKLTGHSNLACVEDKKTIFLQNRGDGSLCYYISFRRSKQWLKELQFDFANKALIVSFLKSLFSDWSPIYTEIFNATGSFNGFPLRVFPADIQKRKAYENTAIIGDAAHVMTPFGGMGVNMGLRDALTLTDNLTGDRFTTISAAIADYEKQMRIYAKPIQDATSQADDRIHNSKEHSLFNMKKKMTANFLKVLNSTAIFFLMLTVGVFWGSYLSLSRSYDLLPLSELIHVGKIIVANLALPMRVISILTIGLMVTSVYMQIDKKSRWFYFLIMSIVCLLIPLILTVTLEVPINNQVISWSSLTAPTNWKDLINQWEIIGIIRVVFALLSFGFFTAGVIKPFHRDLNL
nr:FAD-dependent oxidoreductase [Pedobacter panaciterrae]